MRALLPRSLRARLFLLIFLAGIPAFAYFTLEAMERRQEALARETARVSNALQSLAAQYRTQTDSMQAVLRGLALSPELKHLVNDRGPCQELLSGLLWLQSHFLNLGTTDARGNVTCSALPLDSPVNVADRAYFRRAQGTLKFAVGEYQVGRLTGIASINFAYPLLAPDGRFNGVVFAAVGLTWLDDMLAWVSLPRDSEVLVVDGGGQVLAHYPMVFSDKPPSIASTPLFEAMRSGEAKRLEVSGLEGIERIFAVTPLHSAASGQVYLAAGVPKDAVLVPLEAQFKCTLAIGAAVGVLLFLALFVGSQFFILRPIQAVVTAARRLAEGQLLSFVPVATTYAAQEAQLLSSAFNHMAMSLKAHMLERDRAASALRAGEERLRSLIEGSSDIIAELDPRGRIGYVSPSVELILGHGPAEVLGRMALRHVHRADRRTVSAAFRSGFGPGHGGFRVEHRMLRKDGSVRYLETLGTTRHGPAGEDIMVLHSRDVTERKAYEQKIQYLATHDALTGLPNRATLEDRILQALAHARSSGRFVAVLFVDLNRFKVINDAMGHAAGDELLKEVARRLEAALRDGDTVARLGGDEFVIVASSLRKREDALIVVDKVLEGMNSPFRLQGEEIYTTASVGASLFPMDGTDIDSLLGKADAAMYRAKASGGNEFRFYSEELGTFASEQIKTESALRLALAERQFELHYQPLIDAAALRVVGAEALLRWKHPEQGLVPPARFIPVAEETGLIVPIGEWVLRAACAEWHRRRNAGLPRLRLAVNLSARQFWERRVVELMAQALKDNGIEPGVLEIEVTESVVMRDIESTIRLLQELKSLGVGVAIDDFGTGYSSLSYLRRLPIDRLKIDQSFVRDIGRDPAARRLVTEIIRMAHALGMSTVAEGVETAQECEFLRENGCDELQGYYFAKPAPAAQFERLI